MQVPQSHLLAGQPRLATVEVDYSPAQCSLRAAERPASVCSAWQPHRGHHLAVEGTAPAGCPCGPYNHDDQCLTWGWVTVLSLVLVFAFGMPDNTTQTSWPALMQGWRNQELLRRKKINPVSSLRNVSNALPSSSSQAAADPPKRTLSDSIWRLGKSSVPLEEVQTQPLSDLM